MRASGGRSKQGPRGDAIVQSDWSVGEILASLNEFGLTDNTLVIFTSDNGPVMDDGYKDDAAAKLGTHYPSGPFRGGKSSNFEAGTRVPFIVRWPGHTKRGVSNALVSHVDLLATLAAMTGQTLGAAAAPDSVNLMQALLGRSASGRATYVEQGSGLALRQGRSKYIEPNNRTRVNANTNTELGNDTAPQLYDLTRDPGEKTNLAATNPAKVKEMEDLLRRIRQAGEPITAVDPQHERSAALFSSFSLEHQRLMNACLWRAHRIRGRDGKPGLDTALSGFKAAN